MKPPKPDRNTIWKHNSLFGGTSMAKSLAIKIQTASTTTDESKELARELYDLTNHLYDSLKTRRDQE